MQKPNESASIPTMSGALSKKNQVDEVNRYTTTEPRNVDHFHQKYMKAQAQKNDPFYATAARQHSNSGGGESSGQQKKSKQKSKVMFKTFMS